jgi:hypothetical protein
VAYTQLQQQPNVLDLGVQRLHLALEFEQGIHFGFEVRGSVRVTWGLGRVHAAIVSAACDGINPASKCKHVTTRAKKRRLAAPFSFSLN